jgi:hypothetical protein
MVATDPEVKRLVHEFWVGCAEEYDRLERQELTEMNGYLVDFLEDLLNFPLVRPWRESLDQFQEHYWQQIGLRLTPESYQIIAAYIEREISDPRCFAHGPIRPDATGMPPGQRPDGIADSLAVNLTSETHSGVGKCETGTEDAVLDAFKPHPSNRNVSYWIPPDSKFTEADVVRAFQVAAVVRELHHLITQLRLEQGKPGALRQINGAFNPFADRFRQDSEELSNLWDLEVMLFELETEWIIQRYDRIQWSTFGIPARAGLDFAGSIVTSGPPHAMREVTVGALLNVVGTAALLKLGGALLARGGMRLLTGESAIVRILPKTEGSVWDLGWSLRGQKIEGALGHNVPSGFPTIDRWIAGQATSIKSMDLRAPTYVKPEAVLRVGSKYIDDLLNFSSTARAGLKILPGEVRSRTLRLAVPPQMTESQRAALQSVIEYGRVNGVTVEIQRVY